MITETTTTRPTFYPRNVVSRATQLGIAHQLAAQLGFETCVGKPGRDAYEARLVNLVGVTSLKRATREQRQVVIRAFEQELATRRPVYADDDFSDESCLELLGEAA